MTGSNSGEACERTIKRGRLSVRNLSVGIQMCDFESQIIQARVCTKTSSLPKVNIVSARESGTRNNINGGASKKSYDFKTGRSDDGEVAGPGTQGALEGMSKIFYELILVASRSLCATPETECFMHRRRCKWIRRAAYIRRTILWCSSVSGDYILEYSAISETDEGHPVKHLRNRDIHHIHGEQCI